MSASFSKDLLIIKEPFLHMAQTPPPGGKVSRRDFLKLMAAAGTVMTFAPFVDWDRLERQSARTARYDLLVRGSPGPACGGGRRC